MIVGTTSSIKPPFTEETARAKVKAAQDAWNTKNPEVVATGCQFTECYDKQRYICIHNT